MPTFFKHENQGFPPSFDYGTLRSNAKSDLMDLLPAGDDCEPLDYFDAIAIDGTALVNLPPTANIKIFNEYAASVFLSYLIKQLERCVRLEIVWDTYLRTASKNQQEKSGAKHSEENSWKNMVPTNWNGFLRDGKNKQELFEFLSNKIAAFKYPESKEVFVTQRQSVMTNERTLEMPSCNHEEADTRLIVHIVNALTNGQSTCLVRTVDTDVVIILVGKFYYFTVRVLSRKIILGGKLVLRAVLVAPGGGCGRGVCPLLCEAWKLSPF